MTRRDLFKALGVGGGGLVATARAVNGEPLTIMPYSNNDLRKEEYHYARVEFSVPRMIHTDIQRLDTALTAELNGVASSMRALAKVLAEEKQAVWHAGWIHVDGCRWRHRQTHDTIHAILAVNSRHDAGAEETYNRVRIHRAIYDPNVRYDFIRTHMGMREGR